jgi:hypothetical protein
MLAAVAALLVIRQAAQAVQVLVVSVVLVLQILHHRELPELLIRVQVAALVGKVLSVRVAQAVQELLSYVIRLNT